MAFRSEIILQIKIAKRASERLQIANDNLDSIEVWGAIQSILVATGNVSKILWPAKINENRGKMLRQMLDVKENNLLSAREFRNHFEHYDSRLEEFFKKQGDGGIHYEDLAMNPSMRVMGLGMDAVTEMEMAIANVHRGYNAFNNTLIYRGDILGIDKLMDALEDIHDACKRIGPDW